MKTVKGWGKALLIVLSMALLGACGKKPPECADAKATSILRQILEEQATGIAGYRGENTKWVDQEVVRDYVASWTLTVSNIATLGYNEASQTRRCQAKAVLAIPGEELREVAFAYEMQRFEDSKNEDFELRSDAAFVGLARAAANSLHKHYQVASVRGTWQGKPNCQPARILSKSQGQFPDEEAANGFEIVSTEHPWVADGPETSPLVTMTASLGNVTMTIAQGAETPLIRTGRVSGTGTIKLEQVDAAATVVTNLFTGIEGGFQHWREDLGTRARLKSIATGKEHEAVLIRSCELKLMRK